MKTVLSSVLFRNFWGKNVRSDAACNVPLAALENAG